MNEEMWKAILQCDPSYDGKFFYAVDTTGVFCKPSCKSRNPKRANVRVFTSVNDAIAAKFRPCKRCRPDQPFSPDEDLALQAVTVIESRYQEPLTLQRLAAIMHISPSHLHRTFRRVKGLTPAEYLRITRLRAAKRLLADSRICITDVGIAVGFPNVGHFSTVFQKEFGLVPSAFRKQSQTGFREER